jgi:1-acyl-sn-glycerol-3-phosphate acyltransferase
MFFLGGVLLATLAGPILLLVAGGRRGLQRDRMTGFVNRSYGFFLWWMRIAGLIGYETIEAPGWMHDRTYVLVANHPTLIDALFLLHRFPRLTCLVKPSWYRVWFFGALLRSTHYLPGTRSNDLAEGPHRALDDMMAHLAKGHPLLVFPEGTRSSAQKLRRFRRGPFEAARRAGVPIVPVFIHVDRAVLMKGQPFWRVPTERSHWSFELLPTIDPSSASSGRALRDTVQREFERHFRRSLARRRDDSALPDLEGTVEKKTEHRCR